MVNVYLSSAVIMKFTCIPMYSFKISQVGGFAEVSTSMCYILSPRMALENNGFVVKESSFEKGDFTFQYYPSLDKTVNINVWDGDTLVHSIRNADYINVIIVFNECVVIYTSDYRVTIKC